MSGKKTAKKVLVEDIVEETSPVMFKDNDYFTAQKGKIKFRGQVFSDYDHVLANSTVGGTVDCEDDAIEGHPFSRQIVLSGNTLEDLEDEGITNFKVVKDKRIIKLIDADLLPKITGFRAYKSDNGVVSFGCGAVSFDVKEMKLWHTVMTQVKKIKGFSKFMEMNAQIEEDGDVEFDELMDIDLDDVLTIINKK